MAGSAVAFAFIGLAVLCSGTPVSKVASIPIDQVTFQLYTWLNPKLGNRLVVGDSNTLIGTAFNPSFPTKIIVHGWMEDLQTTSIQNLREEFLALERMNVIAVGWPECSRVVLYEKSVECAKQVGGYIGELVVWLASTTGLSPANVHGVGHSLGAQAMSFASRVVRIGHITALDAAAPLFMHEGPDSQLDAGDADFVDAFHTSTNLVGIKFREGHVDFYPNGGAEQPGCNPDIFGACAHGASTHFYSYTISKTNRNAYLAYKCDSVEQARNQSCAGEPRAVMGYGVSPTTSGVYYLNIPSVPN